MTVPPGSTIGIIGGGQLGRMLSIAASQIGYKCHVYDPHEAPCAAAVAAEFTRGPFNDGEALERFAAGCDVVTYEFENLNIEALRRIESKLRPGVESLEIAQDRAREKQFIADCGARVAEWRNIDGPGDISDALRELGGPLVLKTRRYGYDGKGQTRVTDGAGAESAWESIGSAPAVAEMKIDYEAEFSVVIARGLDGETRAYPVPRNTHSEGILRRSEIPAGEAVERQSAEGIAVAERIVERLGHVGVLTVEFFACDGGPLVNEYAPRVHNSGHWTIEGATTSQFEQHVRAICGLPLGDTALVAPGVTMDNLIGTQVERWPQLVAEAGTHLHLYGKDEARPGRKMGHVTRLHRG